MTNKQNDDKQVERNRAQKAMVDILKLGSSGAIGDCELD